MCMGAILGTGEAAMASMSEFKKNPVAVLKHNRAAFYRVEPQLFEAMRDALADRGLHRKTASRPAEKVKHVKEIENAWAHHFDR
jgi:PHD/YefM family antitoxin component YafN of YafNO toxin-antitoxin module